MSKYFKWEGIDDRGRGGFCEGVIEGPGLPDRLSEPVTKEYEAILKSRLETRGVQLVWWQCIGPGEYRDRQRKQSARPMGRIVCGVVGLAAATLLLPVPVAIWAASAFAALTVSAAVPP